MKAIESNSKELHSQSEAGWTKNEQPNEDKSKNYMPPYFLYKKQLTKLIDVKWWQKPYIVYDKVSYKG